MDPEPERFKPTLCPRPFCRFHLSAAGWHWVRFGSFRRHCEPRTIPRFRCGHCRATLSAQTFSTTYDLKRPELQAPIFHRLLTCSGYCQMALKHLGPLEAPREPGVLDGFESFAYSQYHPLHLNLLVGPQSHFTYAFTHSELRRKGTMRAAQKRRRAWLDHKYGRPDPRAIEQGVAELIRLAAPEPTQLVVRSDEHPAYPRAFRGLKGWSIRHECAPTVMARTAGNPLFPVNRADLQLRHNSANHKRETIAFSKRHQGVVERITNPRRHRLKRAL